MAKRRKSTRKATGKSRKSSRFGYEPPPRVSVKFVGEEIDAAIARIRERAEELPSNGQRAAKRAVRLLRTCRRGIQFAICDGWGAKS